MNSQESPWLSVIMSVYNGERYILRAVLSILAQTFENFELILIDDGSTDGTAGIVGQMQDERIKFYRQDNIGLTKTLNKALAYAKGRWIARHDADDFSIVTRFARQIDFLDKNPEIGLLGSSCFIQPEKHGIINEIYEYPERHYEITAAFPFYNPFVHGSMMIRRDVLEGAGGYNEKYRYVQDYELWSRLLPKVQSGNLGLPLYVRSVHQQSSQMSIDKEPILKEISTNYLRRSGKEVSSSFNNKETVRRIKSKSLYPMVTVANGWNRSIAETYYQMSCVARSHRLPWGQLFGVAFFHCPWFLGRRDHA